MISPGVFPSIGTKSSGSARLSSYTRTILTSSSVQERPAEPAISGKSYGLRKQFQKVSVVP